MAANPSASPETLTELAADMDDFMSRLHAAQNPSTPLHVIQDLARDPNEQVSRAAWARLGGGRPGTIPSNPVIGRPFRFNPKTGRFE